MNYLIDNFNSFFTSSELNFSFSGEVRDELEKVKALLKGDDKNKK